MKYSIIIPTLNEAKLLEPMLKGFAEDQLNEIFNFEVIVSDGGSTDETINIAQKYASLVIPNIENTKQNISIGRNIGAAKANGEILIFINADVVINDPKYFLCRVKNFSDQNNFLAMTCNVKVFPEEETFLDKLFLGFYNWYFSMLNIIGLGMGRGECQIIRTDLFNKLGGYNETYPAGEDFDLYRRIRRKGKILFDKKLTVFESPRRYRVQGHLRTMIRWSLNAFFVMFKKRAVSKEWEQVR